jgi:hypothetical protein
MYFNNMIYNKFKLVFFVVGLMGLVLANPVIAQEATSEPAAAPVATPAEAASEAVAAEAPAADLDPGMQIPVDGSSLEAFNESLATIKAQAKEANYISLEEAIKYLLVYDLGAQNDKAKLAKNLDGKTGDQIIDLVIWRK